MDKSVEMALSAESSLKIAYSVVLPVPKHLELFLFVMYAVTVVFVQFVDSVGFAECVVRRVRVHLELLVGYSAALLELASYQYEILLECHSGGEPVGSADCFVGTVVDSDEVNYDIGGVDGSEQE